MTKQEMKDAIKGILFGTAIMSAWVLFLLGLDKIFPGFLTL